MANLSLMALGSSAPEILLSVLETVQTLGEPAGELGPSTIVGSAAFNLLVISGACIIAVNEEIVEKDKHGKVTKKYFLSKKIDDMGVFATTAIFSIFAYVWLYVCLMDNVITIVEAWLTLFFFFLLLGIAFGADKYNEMKKKKAEDALSLLESNKKDEMKIKKSHLRVLAKKYGEKQILGIVQGLHTKDIDRIKEAERADIVSIYKELLNTDDLSQFGIAELKQILEPESLLERFAAKKAVTSGKTEDFLSLKGQKG